ncbi:MAG: GNAT family N-acetyltransferase [Nanoarchaeota archaeon]
MANNIKRDIVINKAKFLDIYGQLKKVKKDFEKLKMIGNLEIRQIRKNEFKKAMEILSDELKVRVRDNNFLSQKFKEFPQFFIGVFLDNELIGIISGFPRDDYLLISELAIDSKFQGRGFGKRLVKYFEEIAKKNYNKINVGVQDETIGFYKGLKYKYFLLIQYKKEDYSLGDFSDFKIINYNPESIEVQIEDCNQAHIEKLRKKYSKANFQYIFTKDLK